jgi:hypothetical protein
MKDKSSASYLRFTWLALCSSLLLLGTPTFAATKLPVLDVDKGFLVSDTSEIVGFTKLGENWIIAGVDGQERSWLSLVNQKGSELWRSFPIDLGKGGEGFLTAVAVDSQRILVAGVAQNELTLSGEPIPEVSPTSDGLASPSPSPTPPATEGKGVPIVNPDNVIPGEVKPIRKDINRVFVARFDLTGRLVTAVSAPNNSGFIPNSIAVGSTNIFLAGNEINSVNQSRGALFKFSESAFIDSYSYGEGGTNFKDVLAISTKSLTVVGSSAETLANRKVVGKADGIILTVSQSNGKIIKILRSSNTGAVRSWDFVSGNLQVSGTSRTKTIQEGVVTSFTSKGQVRWTIRFQKSSKALADGNCLALATSTSDVLLYVVDSKGKQIKGARLPKQELYALASNSPASCAVLTSSSASGIRVSYL